MVALKPNPNDYRWRDALDWDGRVLALVSDGRVIISRVRLHVLSNKKWLLYYKGVRVGSGDGDAPSVEQTLDILRPVWLGEDKAIYEYTQDGMIASWPYVVALILVSCTAVLYEASRLA